MSQTGESWRRSQRQRTKPDRFGDWAENRTTQQQQSTSANANNHESVSRAGSHSKRSALCASGIHETKEELELQLSGLLQEIQEVEKAVLKLQQEIKDKTAEIELDSATLLVAAEEERQQKKEELQTKMMERDRLKQPLQQKEMIRKQLTKCKRKIEIKILKLAQSPSSSEDEDEQDKSKDDGNQTVIEIQNDDRSHQSMSDWVKEAADRVAADRIAAEKKAESEAKAAEEHTRDQEFEEEQLAEIDRIEKEAEAKKKKIATDIENRRKQRESASNPPPIIPPVQSGSSEQLMIQLLQTQLLLLQQSSTNTISQPVSNRFLARQSHAKDLPFFSGRPEEWPTFITTFNETTELCGFSDAENMGRLRKCLKGDASSLVECLMVSSGNLSSIINLLENRYGQPQHIVKALINRAKGVPAVKEEKLESIIEFGIAVQNMVSTMKALKCETHLLNPQLLEELENKLSVRQRMDWLKWIKANIGRTQSLSDFSEWLQIETEFASRLCPPKSSHEVRGDKRDERRRPEKRVFTTTDPPHMKPRKGKCNFCDSEGHWMYECRKFAKLNEDERWKQATQRRLCFLCLKTGHRTDVCKSKRLCGQEGCSGRHHQLLHKSRTRPQHEPPSISSEQESEDPPPVKKPHVGTVKTSRSDILLKIVPVVLTGPAGELKTYAFFDEGSTISMMDSATADKLGLRGETEPLCIQWTNGITRSEPNSRRVSVRICGDYRGSRQYRMHGVRTMKNLSLPNQTVDTDALGQQWAHLKDAPVNSMLNVKPTLLIGEDYLPLIVSRKVIHGPWTAPYLSSTWLGWVIHGRESSESQNRGNKYSFSICHQENSDDLLHQIVKDSFRTENFRVRVTEEKPRSREDKRAIAVMEQTTTRIGNRFQTGLLWKDQGCNLPDSRYTALHRLYCLEKKIDKDDQLMKWYDDKIQDYVYKGFVKKLTHEEAAVTQSRTWYLPHFFAFHPNKPGKPRLVFDAAAKTKGVSLNDHLMKGPDLVNPLPTVLFKFRQRRYGITADIQEMFHQVMIRPEDRCSQRFLWRGSDREKNPDVYELQVMFFGSTSSPTSAQFVKNLNAAEFKEEYPSAYEAIVNKHYVDDYIDSVDTTEEGSNLATQVTEVHRRGGFHIRGWVSNERSILNNIPADLRAEGLKYMDQVSEIPT